MSDRTKDMFIEDCRVLVEEARAQGHEDGVKAERARVLAIRNKVFAGKTAAPALLALLSEFDGYVVRGEQP